MDNIRDLGNGFWNIRGVHRLGGIVNVGTQASLVRLRSGGFVMLDSVAMNGQTQAAVLALTDSGRAVRAILNLHPFHTLHCATAAAMFPGAALYGSIRHRQRHPDLDWQPDTVESPQVAARFADDLDLSLPQGIDYISADQRVHAGSLVAYHPASRTVHVDDTLNVLPLPNWLNRLMRLPELTLHPTLPRALQNRPDALTDFHAWLKRIGRDWADARTVCAAHSGVLTLPEGGFAPALDAAWSRAGPWLRRAGLQP